MYVTCTTLPEKIILLYQNFCLHYLERGDVETAEPCTLPLTIKQK